MQAIFQRTMLASIVLAAMTLSAAAQTASQPMITSAISENALTTLAGNTRFEANRSNDRGLVSDAHPMEHMMLQLRRPAAQEQALTQYIDDLHDGASPNFQHWLTPEQFGAQFGPSQADIQKVTGWLQSRGFTVNVVYTSGMTIDFSGTAGQVRDAFHTEIHHVMSNGAAHIANMSDPQIPEALGPAVVGVVALHDFRPRSNMVRKETQTDFTVGNNFNYYVTPADLATIYNFLPIFNGGNTGQSQTIYLIEDTNLYSANDWLTFRSTFGVNNYSGSSLSTVHPAPPSGSNNCSNPGVNGNGGEAILDAEWASAAAPGAAIVMATCADTSTTNGLFVAIQNLLNASTPPGIISVSYGGCEVNQGAAGNAIVKSMYQQGVAEGTSIYVSSGDQDAGVCDGDTSTVTHGVSVNALASTPYNVAVGGTDFSDYYSSTSSTYWNASNSGVGGSAKSYIPEIPWNGSCASKLIASFEGYANTYGANGFCNAGKGFINNTGGSGGPSLCATGSASVSGVVSGTCAGYPKPAWQTGFIGVTNDGVRDLPDVSLFAASGTWGHSYIYCYTDPSHGGTPCTGSPSGWSLAGGTSFASPIMAGVQALINQRTGQRQGNPNYRLYQLAKSQYGANGSSSCNSSNGNTVGSSCIFYDVTLGDIDAPCTGPYNCYRPSGTYGVLSTSNSSYAPAFTTNTGWDFATGIGTVNVGNLVTNWGSGSHFWTVAGIGDFNHTGGGDILWRSPAGDVGISYMSGASLITYNSIGSAPTNWTIYGVGDFNGDGNSDILWEDSSGNVAIWFMSGSQLIAYPVIGTVPTNWSIVGVGDFNGDGKADILFRDGSGNIIIWFMSGGNVIATNTVANLPSNWSVAGVGDFNGDGKSDILFRNNTTGDLGLWFMNGGSVIAYSTFGNIPLSWSVAGVGDFNGDGKSDILFINTSGAVGIWLMNGGQVLSYNTLVSLPAGWSVAGVHDFNFDGKADILFRDTASNAGIWLMNGAQVLSYNSIGNVP